MDDEDSIRKLVRMILESRGYTVLDASDGVEGLAVCRNHPGRIDLLLSDIIMPKLDGRALAAGALEMRPDMRVLLMSGYDEDMVFDKSLCRRTGFLQKPFTPAALEKKLRATLDSRAAAA